MALGLKSNQGSLTQGGSLTTQDIEDVNRAVPGQGAQGFMKWQPDPRTGASVPMSGLVAGLGDGSSYGDLSTGVAPADIDAAWVKGRLMATDEQLAKNEDAREASDQGMEEEEFGWKKNEYGRAVAIREGMAQAAQLGGYTGVVEYLKQVDPDRALEFEKGKNELDQALMSTDVFKMAHSNDKLKVMAEGYSIISKMGAGLLNAKNTDEAQAMWDGMKPMAEQILGEGNVPADVRDPRTQGMFMMAAAQNDPKNLIANANLTNMKASSTIGKLQQDARNYLAAGGSTKDKDYQDIQAQIASQNNKAKQTEMLALDMEVKQKQLGVRQSKDKIQAKAAAAQLDKTVGDMYKKDSKGYEEYLETSAGLEAAINALKENPNDPIAKVALKRNVAMANNKGQLTDPDVQDFAQSDSVLVQALKKVESIGTGVEVVLTPDEIGRLVNLANHMKEVQEARQAKRNRFWQQQAKDYSTEDHQVKINYYQAVPKAARDELKKKPTPENIQYFKDTFNVSDTYINSLLKPLKDPADQVGN